MKTAICITGICRGNVKRNVQLLKKVFSSDIFFGTWKGYEKDLSKYKINNFYTFEEPVIEYHPLADISDEIMPPVWKTWLLREEVKKNISLRNKMANYTKQIFGHDYILKVIPEEYDMIIRVRYDTLISDKVDFNHYLNMSYNEHKAIGFGIRNKRHNNLHELKPLPHVWPKKDGPSPGVSNDWGGYLMDPLIFHRRDMWNSKLMHKLNKEKKLLPAERGWYQILSQPYGDNHESVYGGAQIEKYLGSTKA